MSADALPLKRCALSVCVWAEKINIPFFFPVHWLNIQVGMNSTWLSVCVVCQTTGASAWGLPFRQSSTTREIWAMLQVLKLCSESLKCFQGHYRFSLYFCKILYGLWWQLALGYSKHFWLHYKDLLWRTEHRHPPGNDLHFSVQQHAGLKSNNLIFSPRNLKLAH